MRDEPPRDRPDAAELLAVAGIALERDVLPGLAGDALLAARMIRRAMAIAERELRSPVLGPLDVLPLIEAIRAGRHDDDPALHARLVADARARLAIANPKALPGPAPDARPAGRN